MDRNRALAQKFIINMGYVKIQVHYKESRATSMKRSFQEEYKEFIHKYGFDKFVSG